MIDDATYAKFRAAEKQGIAPSFTSPIEAGFYAARVKHEEREANARWEEERKAETEKARMAIPMPWRAVLGIYATAYTIMMLVFLPLGVVCVVVYICAATFPIGPIALGCWLIYKRTGTLC